MSNFSISFADSGYQLDRDELLARLLARWPGIRVKRSPYKGEYPHLVFYLPPHSVYPRIDPTAPGGLDWYPRLKMQIEQETPLRWGFLPEIDDHPIYHCLSPDGLYLWSEDAEDIDCAILAVWLRDWLPPDVPLIAQRVHDEHVYTSVEVRPGMTRVEATLGLLGEQQARGRGPKLLPEPTTEDLVRAALGDEAAQFFPKKA